MKTTGITRRIDELGRIVIPKEIRKNMHIKSGELLEIYLADQDTITLKKHSIINGGQSFIECFVKRLGSQLKCKVYLTSLNNVIFSTNSIVVNDSLSDKLENSLNSDKINFNDKTEIQLTENYIIKSPFDVQLISPNGDLSGLLIFEFNDNLTESDKSFIKFSTAFLNEYLEEE